MTTSAPDTLAAHTVRNFTNDVLVLLRIAVEQGWLPPLPEPLFSWRQRRALEKNRRQPYRKEMPPPLIYYLPFTQCPPALQEQLTAYIRWCEAPVARGRDRHVIKRPNSSVNSRQHILRLAGFATHMLHQPVEALTLAGLCQLDLLEAFINWWVVERNGKVTGGLHQMLITPATIARHWLKDAPLATALNALRQSLPAPVQVRNKDQRWLTLAELEEVGRSIHPRNPRRLHDYPNLKRASYLRAYSGSLSALYVACSLMVRLLIRLPMRQRCLREMELGKNLYRDHAGVWQIRFVGKELKIAEVRGVQRRYEFPFPSDLVSALDEWLEVWRPKVAPPGETAVFVNMHGKRLVWGVEISRVMSSLTYRLAGVGVTPHIIRDIWATEYLEKFPGDVGGAARRLGNTEEMVLRHYAHILKRNVDARADRFLQETFAPDIHTSRTRRR